MIPIDAFMALYDALPGSDEIELQFFSERPHDYMVIKDEDCAIFQAMGMASMPGFRFRLLGISSPLIYPMVSASRATGTSLRWLSSTAHGCCPMSGTSRILRSAFLSRLASQRTPCLALVA